MIEQYKTLLQTLLTEKRYRHSVCVADEARRLALRYGADPERAVLAGLLHDICKDFHKTAFLQFFEEFGIILDSAEKAEPKLWHAIAGEAYLRRRLNITDEAVLSAVRYHTTARGGMSPLEKVLYVADFTSADRDYDDVDAMRACAEQSLEDAMRYALRYTVRDLADRSRLIHPDTIFAYNEAFGEKLR